MAVCTAEYEALRDGTDDGFLDGYASVNPAEFFAVATEAFFDLPVELEVAKPDSVRGAPRLLPPGPRPSLRESAAR